MTEEILPPPVPEAEDTSAPVRAYGMLMLGLILALIPVMFVQGLGFLLLLVGVIYTYFISKSADLHPLASNHRRWLIRTYWISSALFIVGYLLLAGYVVSNFNPEVLAEIERLATQPVVDYPAIAALNQQLQEESKDIVFWGSIIAYAPSILFMFLRLLRGYRLLDASQPVPNVKTWLI